MLSTSVCEKWLVPGCASQRARKTWPTSALCATRHHGARGARPRGSGAGSNRASRTPRTGPPNSVNVDLPRNAAARHHALTAAADRHVFEEAVQTDVVGRSQTRPRRSWRSYYPACRRRQRAAFLRPQRQVRRRVNGSDEIVRSYGAVVVRHELLRQLMWLAGRDVHEFDGTDQRPIKLRRPVERRLKRIAAGRVDHRRTCGAVFDLPLCRPKVLNGPAATG